MERTMTEAQKSWTKNMTPTRRIKVNTVVRGRGRVLLHAKSCNGPITGYWYVIKEDNKYVSLLSVYAPGILGHRECTPYSRYEASSLKDAYKELSCEVRKCARNNEAWKLWGYERPPFDWQNEEEWN